MKPVFVVNVFRNQPLADILVSQIEKYHPEASRLIVPDEPRLKHLLTGEWTQRYLEQALATDADVIIKCDPDMHLNRRARIPSADWFGEISSPCLSLIWGGACGFSRAAAGKLVSSKLLLLPSPFSYRWPRGEASGETMSFQDLTVAVIMRRLGIVATPWSDVRIFNQGRPRAFTLLAG